jgi:hypothetical protein
MSTKPTHAEVARNLVSRLPAGVFAHAALDVVTSNDYTTLERMLPGVRFNSRKVRPDHWELIGVCADGSTVVWGVVE